MMENEFPIPVLTLAISNFEERHLFAIGYTIFTGKYYKEEVSDPILTLNRNPSKAVETIEKYLVILCITGISKLTKQKWKAIVFEENLSTCINPK